VPVVRRVGGLADTVHDAGATDRAGNGFLFDHAQPDALRDALARAFALYRQRDGWLRLMHSGMGENLSWEGPARHYLSLYEQARSARRDARRRDVD
jgi:starch synthase